MQHQQVIQDARESFDPELGLGIGIQYPFKAILCRVGKDKLEATIYRLKPSYVFGLEPPSAYVFVKLYTAKELSK